jgi:hypothetical protein
VGEGERGRQSDFRFEGCKVESSKVSVVWMIEVKVFRQWSLSEEGSKDPSLRS